MKFTWKEALKYLFFIAIAVLLLRQVYANQDWDSLSKSVAKLDVKYIYYSIALSMVGHLVRAMRWSLTLKPVGYNVPIGHSFLSVMSGYFANSLVPRLGEFVRCALLQKTAKVPVNVAFGSVITERLIDFVCLLLIMGLALVLEFDRIGGFLMERVEAGSGNLVLKLSILAAVGVAGLLLLYLLWRIRKRFSHMALYKKTATFLQGLKQGVLSIKGLKPRQRFMYIFLTFCTWTTYVLFTWLLFFSSEATEHLGIAAGISLMILGGVGMVLPTPGGIGSFHFFVANGLQLYGVAAAQAGALTLVMHASQWLSLVVFGAIALLITMFVKPIDTKVQAEQPPVYAS
jgi:uncharacterized protein (TIRG00374 family)